MNYEFQYFNPVKLVFGCGSINEIAEQVGNFGRKGLVVITGDFFIENGLIPRIQKLLKENNIKSEVYSDISPNPLSTQIDEGSEFFMKSGCNFVIGVGGGSAIDAAKAIAVAAGHRSPVWDYCPKAGDNDLDPTEKTIPIIAVTTTSGTGSHVTPFAVVTNPIVKIKTGMGNEHTYPKVSFVDPELMVSLPREITAATGFDALAHAIEAYTSNSASPITDLFAEEAIKLVGNNLRKAYSNGQDLESRKAMALADTFAGYALANAICTLAHSIAQVIGGLFNTVHGTTLAILTPSCMRFSMNHRSNKFRKIGLLLNNKLDREVDKENTIEDSVNQVEKLRSDIRLDISLKEVGIKIDDFDKIADDVLKYMAGAVELDAREVNKSDIIEILRMSY